MDLSIEMWIIRLLPLVVPGRPMASLPVEVLLDRPYRYLIFPNLPELQCHPGLKEGHFAQYRLLLNQQSLFRGLPVEPIEVTCLEWR